MPKNPDLVPTVIVDVNGRTTIVHKLRNLFSSSKSQATASRIPAPVTKGAVVLKSALVDELMRSVSMAAGLTDKSDIERLGKNLHANFSEDALCFFCRVMAREDGFSVGAAKQIAGWNFPYESDGVIDNNGLEVTIRNNALFYPILGVEDYDELYGLVRGTQNTYQDADEEHDFRSLDKRGIEQCAALMMTTKKLNEQYPLPLSDDGHPVKRYLYGGAKVWSLRSRQLYSLVMDRPEDMDKIVEMVVKHRTTNRASLNGLLMGIDAPLAEGAL